MVPSLGHQRTFRPIAPTVELSATQCDQAVVVGVRQRLLLDVREHPDEDAAADVIAIGRDTSSSGPQFSRAIPYG